MLVITLNSNKICNLGCFEGCTGCRSPGTFEDCVECADGYSKYYPDNIIDSTFECLNECPISYYPDLSNVCQGKCFMIYSNIPLRIVL